MKNAALLNRFALVFELSLYELKLGEWSLIMTTCIKVTKWGNHLKVCEINSLGGWTRPIICDDQTYLSQIIYKLHPDIYVRVESVGVDTVCITEKDTDKIVCEESLGEVSDLRITFDQLGGEIILDGYKDNGMHFGYCIPLRDVC